MIRIEMADIKVNTRTRKFMTGLEKALAYFLDEAGFKRASEGREEIWKIRPIKQLSNLQGDIKWIRPEKTYIVGKARIKEIIWEFYLTPDLTYHNVETVFEKITSKKEMNISKNKKLCTEIDEGIDKEINKRQIKIEDLSDPEAIALMALDEIKNEENEINSKLAGPAIRREMAEPTSQKMLVRLTQLKIIERLHFGTTIEGTKARTKGYRITQTGLGILYPTPAGMPLGIDVEASKGIVDDDNNVEAQESIQISDGSRKAFEKACDDLKMVVTKMEKNVNQKEKFIRLIDEADEENKTLCQDRVRKEREIRTLASDLGFDLESLE
jgi:hypothetical protein